MLIEISHPALGKAVVPNDSLRFDGTFIVLVEAVTFGKATRGATVESLRVDIDGHYFTDVEVPNPVHLIVGCEVIVCDVRMDLRVRWPDGTFRRP